MLAFSLVSMQAWEFGSFRGLAETISTYRNNRFHDIVHHGNVSNLRVDDLRPRRSSPPGPRSCRPIILSFALSFNVALFNLSSFFKPLQRPLTPSCRLLVVSSHWRGECHCELSRSLQDRSPPSLSDVCASVPTLPCKLLFKGLDFH